MSSPPTPTTDDLAWLRQQTNGAAGWTDDALTSLMREWVMTVDLNPEPPDDDMDTGGPLAEASEPTTVVLDRWAAAAMVLEYRLLAALEDPATGTQQARSGDAHVAFNETGGSTWLLRVFIRRYWRLADGRNRLKVHPTGWRSLNVRRPRRMALVGWPHLGTVVNGNAGIDGWDRD